MVVRKEQQTILILSLLFPKEGNDISKDNKFVVSNVPDRDNPDIPPFSDMTEEELSIWNHINNARIHINSKSKKCIQCGTVSDDKIFRCKCFPRASLN